MNARTPARAERRLLNVSIVIGMATLVAVVVAGFAFALTRPERFEARASMVVLPDDDISDEDMAGYYETLNQGQVVATFAEILRTRFSVDDVDRITDVQRADVSSKIEVVPDTAVIEITASAPEEADAVEVANAIAEEASDFVADLTNPYQLVPLDDAKGEDGQDVSLSALLVVVAIVAIVAALALQQLVFQLGMLLGRRRQLRPASST